MTNYLDLKIKEIAEKLKCEPTCKAINSALDRLERSNNETG